MKSAKVAPDLAPNAAQFVIFIEFIAFYGILRHWINGSGQDTLR